MADEDTMNPAGTEPPATEGPEPSGLEIGLPMRLVLLPVWPDSSGGDVVTYAFEPEGGAT